MEVAAGLRTLFQSSKTSPIVAGQSVIDPSGRLDVRLPNAHGPDDGVGHLERVLKMPSYRFSRASDQETDHTNAQHDCATNQPEFIVAAQSVRFNEPAKGSFYDPAFGQIVEAFDLIGSVRLLQLQPSMGTDVFDPPQQGSQIAAICPNDLESDEPLHQRLDQSLGGVSVWHGGRTDHNCQHQARGGMNLITQRSYAPMS